MEHYIADQAPQSFTQKYKWHVIVVGVILTLILLIVFLMQPRTIDDEGDVFPVISGEVTSGLDYDTIDTIVSDTGLVTGLETNNTSGISMDQMITDFSQQDTSVEREKIVRHYAKQIEELIVQKGELTRTEMILTMQKFMKNHSSDFGLYSMLQELLDIVRLGEFAHKVQYCMQYDDTYNIVLFGVKAAMRSTVKYDSDREACVVTYSYGDGSEHSCFLGDETKKHMSAALIAKQHISSGTSDDFELLLEQMLLAGQCYESKAAIIAVPVTQTGLDQN